MELIDVSVPIRDGMLHYANNPGIRVWRATSLDEGGNVNITELDMGTHTATHVDAPSHFLADGGGADELPLDVLIGPADVVDGTAITGAIDAATLSGLDVPQDCTRLILKTRNSQLWARDDFTHDFSRLDGSGGQWIVDRRIALVGIDYLSIGDHDAHSVLLSNGVVPLEGLDLRAVDPGRYELLCLPLKLVGSDGGPARVVLRRS